MSVRMAFDFGCNLRYIRGQPPYLPRHVECFSYHASGFMIIVKTAARTGCRGLTRLVFNGFKNGGPIVSFEQLAMKIGMLQADNCLR